MRSLKPPPLPLGYTCNDKNRLQRSVPIGAPGEIRTHTARILSAMPPAVGLPAPGSFPNLVLSTGYDPVSAHYQSAVLPLNEESVGARSIDSNAHLSRYKPELYQLSYTGDGDGADSSTELCQRKSGKSERPRRKPERPSEGGLPVASCSRGARCAMHEQNCLALSGKDRRRSSDVERGLPRWPSRPLPVRQRERPLPVSDVRSPVRASKSVGSLSRRRARITDRSTNHLAGRRLARWRHMSVSNAWLPRFRARCISR